MNYACSNYNDHNVMLLCYYVVFVVLALCSRSHPHLYVQPKVLSPGSDALQKFFSCTNLKKKVE